MYIYIRIICIYIYIYIHIYIYLSTSSTAQGGGGSLKNRKPTGEVGCCESRMAERIHWWTERWLELCFWSGWLRGLAPTNPFLFFVFYDVALCLPGAILRGLVASILRRSSISIIVSMLYVFIFIFGIFACRRWRAAASRVFDVCGWWSAAIPSATS